jgi:hypothetical protein
MNESASEKTTPSGSPQSREHVLFHTIDGVWTESLLVPSLHVDNDDKINGIDREIIILPGNPGVRGFYTPFAHQLSSFCGHRYPVCNISNMLNNSHISNWV